MGGVNLSPSLELEEGPILGCRPSHARVGRPLALLVELLCVLADDRDLRHEGRTGRRKKVSGAERERRNAEEEI